MRRTIIDPELYPVFVPFRKSALVALGGSMKNLNDSRRLDHECVHTHQSRDAGHACKKDFRVNGRRDYRPWQRVKTS
jgi:hypothetical protein